MTSPQSGSRPARRPRRARAGSLPRLQGVSRSTKVLAGVWLVLGVTDLGFGVWDLLRGHGEDASTAFASGAVLLVGAAMFVLIAQEHRRAGWRAGWGDGMTTASAIYERYWPGRRRG